MLRALVVGQLIACHAEQSGAKRSAKLCNEQGSCRAPSYLQVFSKASPDASLEQGSDSTCAAQCSKLRTEIELAQGKAVTQIAPFPGSCNQGDVNSERPVQVFMNAAKNGYDVSYLDVPTGEYSKLYEIPLSRTTPEMKDINSCAISPIDFIAYCTCSIEDQNTNTERAFIIRVDGTKVEFVQEIAGKSICGAFDLDGNYYYEGGKRIYFSSNLHALQGYPGLLGFSPVPKAPLGGTTGGEVTTAKKDGKIDGAFHDVVVTKADFEIPGVMEKVAVYYQNNGQKVGNVGVTMVSGPNKGKSYKLTTTGFLNTCSPTDNKCDEAFGAGWFFSGRIFFSRNNAEGVYELDQSSVNLNQLTAAVSKVGESRATRKNDGMNCLTGGSPWTEPPTPSPTSPVMTTASPTTPVANPTPSPTLPPSPFCEDFCISHGCDCLIKWEERCKVKSCQGCPRCSQFR